jgi:hypothetical protein
MNKMVLTVLASTIVYAGWIGDIKQKADEAKNNALKKYENFQEEKKKKADEKIAQCVQSLKVNIPLYRTAIKEYYFNVNKRNENKVLKAYSSLDKAGINADLNNSISNEVLFELENSKSTFQYSNIILREISEIYSELKNGNIENLDKLVNRIRFYMFAWTAPYEIMSTKKIFENSLLGINPKLFNSLSKDRYNEYAQFIYSLLYQNMIHENIFIAKDSVLSASLKIAMVGPAGLLIDIDEKIIGLENMCKELSDSYFKKDPNEYILKNISNTLSINYDKLESDIIRISKNNNIYDTPAFISSKSIKGIAFLNIDDNPLNDSWYMMIREYMELQNNFYSIKKGIANVIKVLSNHDREKKYIAELKVDMIKVDSLYRKLDEIVRYNIIDLPVSIYSDLYRIKFNRYKKWYNDDEEKMVDVAVNFNKACANMQKYMVSDFGIRKVIKTTSTMKSEFDEEKEWKEIQARAKLTQDWFNMLNKITIRNK